MDKNSDTHKQTRRNPCLPMVTFLSIAGLTELINLDAPVEIDISMIAHRTAVRYLEVCSHARKKHAGLGRRSAAEQKLPGLGPYVHASHLRIATMLHVIRYNYYLCM